METLRDEKLRRGHPCLTALKYIVHDIGKKVRYLSFISIRMEINRLLHGCHHGLNVLTIVSPNFCDIVCDFGITSPAPQR